MFLAYTVAQGVDGALEELAPATAAAQRRRAEHGGEREGPGHLPKEVKGGTSGVQRAP